MQILIDTHILLWALFNDERLSEDARGLIEDEENEIYYSTASLLEIGIKHRKNSIEFPFTSKDISDACLDAGFENLPIFNKHAFQLDDLNKKDNSPRHKDPFDLLMLAQAKRSRLKFMTHDHLFKYCDEDCIIVV